MIASSGTGGISHTEWASSCFLHTQYQVSLVFFDLQRLPQRPQYDEETARYFLEQGSYILRVGNSSRSTTPCAVVSTSQTIPVRQLTNIGGKPDFIDWKPDAREAEEAKNLPILELRAEAFAALRWPKPHTASEAARKEAASLSDRDLIRMCMGYYKEGAKGFESVVGNAHPILQAAPAKVPVVWTVSPILSWQTGLPACVWHSIIQRMKKASTHSEQGFPPAWRISSAPFPSCS